MMTAEETTRELLLERADTIKTRRQRWAWDNRIPLGTVTLFAGRGGEGKSTFALHLIAQLNTGTLPGDLAGEPAAALIISHEDDWGTVMVPRLKGAGADLTRVHRLAVTMTTDAITSESVPAFPMDLALIKAAIEQTGARVLVIDPITSTISGDLHKVEAVRAALNPLASLAAEHDVAVIGILHFNKGAGNASDKISGSHAFRDVARSTVLFATDEETGKRIVTFDKSNYSAERGTNLEFTLDSVMIHTDDGETTTVAQVTGLTESDISVTDIINRAPDGEDDGSDRNAAQAFVLDYLTGQGGEAGAGDVIKAGRAAGFTDNEIKNARKRSREPRIESRKASFGSGWVWAISPEGVTKASKVSALESVTPTTPSRHLRPAETPLDDADEEEGAPSYSDHRDQIAARAGMLCPVCNEPTGHRFPGYCDALDNQHATYRADLAAAITAKETR